MVIIDNLLSAKMQISIWTDGRMQISKSGRIWIESFNRQIKTGKEWILTIPCLFSSLMTRGFLLNAH